MVIASPVKAGRSNLTLYIPEKATFRLRPPRDKLGTDMAEGDCRVALLIAMTLLNFYIFIIFTNSEGSGGVMYRLKSF